MYVLHLQNIHVLEKYLFAFDKCDYSRLVFKLDALGWEILGIALPAALAVAADPIASLIDTAFIGHIGTLFLILHGFPFHNRILSVLLPKSNIVVFNGVDV
jgi:hypothetical protein